MDISVIVAGFGGQGALLAGIVICNAAVIEGKQTTWIPSYGAEMRGGSVNCAVNISDDEIGSPVIDKADFVIAMNDISQIKFENKVKPGGCMIINSSLSKIAPKRTDIEYISIPLNNLAQTLEQPAFINVMAVGAFAEKTGALKLESLKAAMTEMAKKLPEKKKKLLPNNITSLQFGSDYIKNNKKLTTV